MMAWYRETCGVAGHGGCGRVALCVIRCGSMSYILKCGEVLDV